MIKHIFGATHVVEYIYSNSINTFYSNVVFDLIETGTTVIVTI